MKKRLIDLVIRRTFKYSQEPVFKLASGAQSSYYFNCKPTMLNSEGMYLIGNLFFEIIKGMNLKDMKAVGGLTLGADPISSAIAYTYFLKGESIEAFVVRKEPKQHGTMQWVEGNVSEGDSVLITEDVVTTGGSTIKAIERARKSGLNVLGVVVLIDRQEGGKEAVEALGVPVETLLTKDEIFESYNSGNQG
ncbi:MAG: orotate phosphoribosyltransferase [Nitrospira sp.]|nr:orotate phosphoribosyltransferase [Nitrospira sp.]